MVLDATALDKRGPGSSMTADHSRGGAGLRFLVLVVYSRHLGVFKPSGVYSCHDMIRELT